MQKKRDNSEKPNNSGPSRMHKHCWYEECLLSMKSNNLLIWSVPSCKGLCPTFLHHKKIRKTFKRFLIWFIINHFCHLLFVTEIFVVGGRWDTPWYFIGFIDNKWQGTSLTPLAHSQSEKYQKKTTVFQWCCHPLVKVYVKVYTFMTHRLRDQSVIYFAQPPLWLSKNKRS